MAKIKKVIKRNGKIEDFDFEKFLKSLKLAFEQSNQKCENIKSVANFIIKSFETKIKRELIEAEQIARHVYESLIQIGFEKAAKYYRTFRYS